MRQQSSVSPMVLIAAGTLCSLSATDLILPAIPMLPTVLEGNATQAQWILAAFALGSGFGLLAFGEIGARFKTVRLLQGALLAFAVLSLFATLVDSLLSMSIVRFFQGVVAAAPAVFAPVMIKSLYQQDRAIAMLGRIGSIEAAAPAIAPIIGMFLLSAIGWKASFYAVALTAIMLCVLWQLQSDYKDNVQEPAHAKGSYTRLLKRPEFMRYALSQALTLGALLTIVFSSPKIIVSTMHGTMSDFIVMQVIGISFFTLAANSTHVFKRWWGDDKTILYGSAITALGCLGLLMASWLKIHTIALLWSLFVFVNLGLGVRGPVGFYKALVASADNDARGSAMIIVLVMVVTALGTSLVAPYIESGLFSAALVASLFALGSVLMVLGPAFESNVTV